MWVLIMIVLGQDLDPLPLNVLTYPTQARCEEQRIKLERLMDNTVHVQQIDGTIKIVKVKRLSRCVQGYSEPLEISR